MPLNVLSEALEAAPDLFFAPQSQDNLEFHLQSIEVSKAKHGGLNDWTRDREHCNKSGPPGW